MAFTLRKPPNLSPKLSAFPYQLDAVKATCELPYAAIFHEQGLGKSKIAIDLVLHWLETDSVDTVFIVTKKSLVQNWMNEISIHSHLVPRVLSENRRLNSHALNVAVLIYVLNYEVLLSNQELISLFLKTCRVGAILDESQKIKNPEAKLSKCLLTLANEFHRKIIMTGTPVANRPQDIWSQIKFLDGGHALGRDFYDFKGKVDIPCRNTSEDYGDALSEVGEKIRNFSIRETKLTAGLELPQKTIISHYVTLQHDQAKIYRNYRDDLCHEFQTDAGKSLDQAEIILKRLLRLVQCASNPILVDPSYREEPSKFVRLRQLLETEIFPQNDKAIIWTSFVKNAEWLTRNLQSHNPSIVHGQLDIEHRNCQIERFKEDTTCSVMVATPGAAKEGLTLTVANHSIFFDRSFSLDDYLQAQDRIHRISQQQECFVHNLIATETIDDWVDRLLYVKFIAAQIAQGDVVQEERPELFQIDLSEMLSEVLSPTKT